MAVNTTNPGLDKKNFLKVFKKKLKQQMASRQNPES